MGTLVTPMGRYTPFCQVVHPNRPDLNLNPVPLRTHNGTVQGFISIDFGGAHPIPYPVCF
ncbi:hypothetical protein SDC9_136971 [bioreactor metagenome]|uniref:Uncharacterized protein n=1 Tax=bioreactor metagenome TaxID=1076179 RepID=A0A645DKM2_9ZZZZ